MWILFGLWGGWSRLVCVPARLGFSAMLICEPRQAALSSDEIVPRQGCRPSMSIRVCRWERTATIQAPLLLQLSTTSLVMYSTPDAPSRVNPPASPMSTARFCFEKKKKKGRASERAQRPRRFGAPQAKEW
ncbi:hypothetical protein IWZ01DRAFT_345004 [Phyllosticta capitalensis]